MKKIKMILAIDEKNWLWSNWNLAWKLSEDMKHFKKITSQTKDLGKLNAVVMWKKTRESIPSKNRPLSQRINCILSRTIKYENINSKIDNFVLYFNSIDSCIWELIKKTNIENIFIIGWANIYNQFLTHPRLDEIYLTKISWDYNTDVFFDWIPSNFELIDEWEEKEENQIKFKFLIYKKIN